MSEAKKLNPLYHLLYRPFVERPKERKKDEENARAQATDYAAKMKPIVSPQAPTLGPSAAPWEPKAPVLNTILGVK